jgi:integrase
MASIETRTLKSGRKSYKVRYIDPDGRERSKTFRKKAHADDFALEVSHQVRAGSYVDPTAGRITVKRYLEQWRQQQAQHRPRTATTVERRLRTMVYPHIGQMPLGQVRPSTIRALQTALAEHYADTTIVSLRRILGGAFNDAVLDRVLATSPLAGVRPPQPPDELVVPLTVDQVRAGTAALRQPYRAVIPVAAGTGLRPSELFGLTVDRVDFLRKTVRVDRQLAGRNQDGSPAFGPPKTPSSNRTIPIGQATIDVLAAHLAAHPPRPHGLVFTNSRGDIVTHETWGDAWAPARAAMGLRPGQGLHQLRHFYASLLIAQGLNVKEVQERLGHKDATITLRTYTHLFPDSDDRTRAAIDAALGTQKSGDATPKDDAAASDQ